VINRRQLFDRVGGGLIVEGGGEPLTTLVEDADV
jgi:hypothetical protein